MPTYQAAPFEVGNLFESMIDRRYPDFKQVELTFKVVFAYSKVDGDTGEATDAPVSVLGGKVAWSLAVINLKGRALGNPDVAFTIDGDHWGELNREEQDALVCEILDSFEVAKDKDGNPKADDLGRPKLKKIPPDQVILFRVKTVQEHKGFAPCAKQLTAAGQMVQAMFQWG